MKVLLVILLVIGLVLAGLLALRWLDARAVAREWARLEAQATDDPPVFDPAMVADLPEPARRFLTWAIRPGTPLWQVAEFEMTGRFGLGDKADPRYQDMAARQIMAPPHGFVWAMRATSGMPVSGSDTGTWTRFRLAGLIPVARTGGSEDHRRSAFGREVAEAAIWVPTTLVPGPGITWAAAGPDTARVTVEHAGMTQSVELTLNAEGAPVSVMLPRWSNANPDKIYQRQPFGGTLSDHREVQGVRLPFHSEVGNFYGEDAYFPFFIADFQTVTFR